MSKTVTIADFGSGNLLSVCRAFAHCGAEVVLAGRPAEIAAAERLVVPGVGAFADSMKGLSERGLSDPVLRFAETGRPLLGICIGLQMLFDSSEEFGRHPGLGLISGEVRRIPGHAAAGRRHKVPHIGWNCLSPAAQDWQGSILEGVAPESFVYYVHSFTAHPTDEIDRLADTDYDGCRIAGAVRRGNVTGCQFHPEKSGAVGLEILRNFLRL